MPGAQQAVRASRSPPSLLEPAATRENPAPGLPPHPSARTAACPYLLWRPSSFVPAVSRGLLGLGLSPPMCSHWLKVAALRAAAGSYEDRGTWPRVPAR